MTINRDTFFPHIRAAIFSNSMSQRQVDGTTALLDFYEQKKPFSDLRMLAYCLATVAWETAHTMQPIEEIGHGKGRVYGAPTGPWHKVYDGRGDVQLTWEANYKKATTELRKLGLLTSASADDLEQHPERALEPAIASSILYVGMHEGWFTGKKLADYFKGSDAECDWKNARRIINGTDHAADVAQIAVSFYTALGLSSTTGLDASEIVSGVSAAGVSRPDPLAPVTGPSPDADSDPVATEERLISLMADTTKTTAAAALQPTKQNLGQLIADFAKGAIAKLENIPVALEGAGSTVAKASTLATEAASSSSNALDAAKEIAAIVEHVESGQWLSLGGDIEKLLADILAVLAKFGINYAPLTELSSLLSKTFAA